MRVFRGHFLDVAIESPVYALAARFGPHMVDDVVRLMDHLKIQRAHLIGHSMGALIVGNVAARYPDRVITASLVAGPFYADEATFERETTRWTTDLEGGKGLHNFMLWLFPAFKPEMAAGFNAQVMKANDLGSLIAVMRSLPKLALAGLPKNGDKALLVAGTGDPLTVVVTRWHRSTGEPAGTARRSASSGEAAAAAIVWVAPPRSTGSSS